MKLHPSLHTFALCLVISALPCAGCLSEEPASMSEIDVPRTNPEGPVLQGSAFNGLVYNGLNYNGAAISGIQFSGARMQGSSSTSLLQLLGGELATQGRLISRGEDLEGATLFASLSNGSSLQLYIQNVVPTADPEIFEYEVFFQDGGQRQNLCGEANGVPIRALALSGRWDESSGTQTGGSHIDDPNLFTFACENAVLAKCVVMGYAPWRSLTECNDEDCRTIPMRDMHQACTRMMRADYCGDGTPHTQNGTTINVWDNFDVQVQDMSLPVTWTDEAEWSPSGATCIDAVRWSGTAEDYVDQHCSNRWSSTASDCFGPGSTFFTAQGLTTQLSYRSLFRNQFTHDPY